MFKKTTDEPQQKASVGTAATKPAATKPSATQPRPASPASPVSSAPAANGELSRDAIAKLAFQKWQKRGCPAGEDQKDWFEAERELKSPQAGRSRG